MTGVVAVVVIVAVMAAVLFLPGSQGLEDRVRGSSGQPGTDATRACASQESESISLLDRAVARSSARRSEPSGIRPSGQPTPQPRR